MKRLVALVAAAAAASAGCSGPDVTSAEVSLARATQTANAPAAPGTGALTVMTWNVYYGTDPQPILGAPLDQVPFVAADVWARAQRTNFPERAGALAAEIAKRQPHLIGLQEAALWRIQQPGDAAFGGTVPATQVVYDFLAILVDSLSARGLHYVVAAADSTTDVEVPVFGGLDPGTGTPIFNDVRLTDRDAVLARADVAITDPQHGVYAAFIPIPDIQSGVYEGWSSVNATVGGRTYRFVATHLEFQEALPVQIAQAHELIDLLASESLPTIVVGDFNSDVFGQDPTKATPSYGLMIDAGFTDTWVRPSGVGAMGLTCCLNDDVSNARSTFDQRLDFIFTRHMPATPADRVLTTSRQVLGDNQGSKTASGLWPSDHAGVVTTFLVPPGQARQNP
jgi:hypothetical protein